MYTNLNRTSKKRMIRRRHYPGNIDQNQQDEQDTQPLIVRATGSLDDDTDDDGRLTELGSSLLLRHGRSTTRRIVLFVGFHRSFAWFRWIIGMTIVGFVCLHFVCNTSYNKMELCSINNSMKYSLLSIALNFRSVLMSTIRQIIIISSDPSIDGTKDDSDALPRYKPSHTACNGYDGIFHISMGDIEGGAGTSLIQLILVQLKYAEENNLKPWVHFSDIYGVKSKVIYDDAIHDDPKTILRFPVSEIITNFTHVRYPHYIKLREQWPGLPIYNQQTRNLSKTNYYSVSHTGLWNFYFYPVSDFVPGDRSCWNKPIVSFADIALIIPGLHGYSPKAIRAWRYDYLPEYISQHHLSYHTWLRPQRHLANIIAKRYLHILPYIHERARKALSHVDCTIPKTPCLGLHIRHSDKAAGRRVIGVSEFLPYVQAFVNAATQTTSLTIKQQISPDNNKSSYIIYIATDSNIVLKEIRDQWPEQWQSSIRVSPNMIRSDDKTAVFDITGSHHRTNQEALVDIVALANCTFLIHGFSAVSESAIWLATPELRLHYQSVNLEDPDHLQSIEFESLVQKTLEFVSNSPNRSDEKEQAILHGRQNFPKPIRGEDEWPQGHDKDLMTTSDKDLMTTSEAIKCKDASSYNGILHIASSGRKATTLSRSLFNSILNQLIYAEKYNLLPWIHLNGEERISQSSFLYDHHSNITSPSTFPDSRNVNNISFTFTMLSGMAVSVAAYDDHAASKGNRMLYPSVPGKKEKQLQLINYTVYGNGVWNMYFEPVGSAMINPSSSSLNIACHDNNLPILRMEEILIAPGLESYCPWSVRSFRYDSVPDSLWWNSKHNSMSLTDWYEPMRIKGHEIVQKYFSFQPYIVQRSREVNPTADENSSPVPCLGVHIRLNNKDGKYRKKIKADDYGEYMDAFQRMGGKAIYLATDSRRAYQYIYSNFPQRLTNIIRSQGQYVVRSSKDYPLYHLEQPHRVNAENLVDILALSKCKILLHSFSTTAEAAIYINLSLHNSSINLEDPNKLSVSEFEQVVRQLTGDSNVISNSSYPSFKDELRAIQFERQRLRVQSENQSVQNDDDLEGSLLEPRIITSIPSSVSRKCHTNAIVYLAQKQHSTYNERDSYGSLLKSLRLLNQNYLSISDHNDNADVFIFHTGDFNATDLQTLEKQLFGGKTGSAATVILVDLSNTTFWKRPKYNANDKPESWYAWPLFSEGYRRMMHWFAIDLWDFFQWYNSIVQLSSSPECHYRYIMRLDEDSFIHSPIEYDIFHYMHSSQYVYGFRMCAYEMQVTQRMSSLFLKRNPSFIPKRSIDLNMCGFYNNFFVADLLFFQSSEVRKFLNFIDQQGHIYRRRLGDIMIHSMAVYWFASSNQIHRFLDFTYEHGTLSNQEHRGKDNAVDRDGCLIWGGIQAGYLDVDSATTLRVYIDDMTEKGCEVNHTFLTGGDLSPTYQHVPSNLHGKLSLETVSAGRVEQKGAGQLSG